MTSVILRRTAIFGTPIVLATLAAIHSTMPMDDLAIRARGFRTRAPGLCRPPVATAEWGCPHLLSRAHSDAALRERPAHCGHRTTIKGRSPEARGAGMNRSIPLVSVAAAAVLYLAATLIVMHAIQAELDPAAHYVSEYALGQLGWLVMVGYVVAGAGVLAMAWRVRSALSGRWALASAACLAIVGLALIATGLTRIDVAQADGSVISTASGQAHELAGYVAILGMMPGAFILSGAFRRDPRLARAAVAARLFAWALLAAFVAVVVFQRLELLGVGQRILIGTWLSWLVFVGLQLRLVERPIATRHVAQTAKAR